MRTVVDTNNVVSRYLVPVGPSARIMDAWEREVFELVVSEPVLMEYERVLNYERLRRRHGMSPEEVGTVIARFRQFAILVEPTESVTVIADDPSDNRFLECAVAGGAEYIVSGDTDLLTVRSYRGIQILRATEFLAMLDRMTS